VRFAGEHVLEVGLDGGLVDLVARVEVAVELVRERRCRVGRVGELAGRQRLDAGPDSGGAPRLRLGLPVRQFLGLTLLDRLVLLLDLIQLGLRRLQLGVVLELGFVRATRSA
jgi:hypothetical protein